MSEEMEHDDRGGNQSGTAAIPDFLYRNKKPISADAT